MSYDRSYFFVFLESYNPQFKTWVNLLLSADYVKQRLEVIKP